MSTQCPNVETLFLAARKQEIEFEKNTRIDYGNDKNVYKVQLTTGFVYAAKVYSNSDAEVKMFTRESKIVNDIITVSRDYLSCFSGTLTYTNSNGQLEHWLITEYLEDYIALHDAVTNNTAMDYAEIYVDMIEGLKVLHDAGVSHQDINPSTILVNTKTNRIKYIDFALACMDEHCERPNRKITQYSAPEALLDKQIYLRTAKKSDMWSLGCVIFSCEHKNQLPLSKDEVFNYNNTFRHAATFSDDKTYLDAIMKIKNSGIMLLSTFERNNSASFKFERNRISFDLTFLINMDFSKRNLEKCYKNPSRWHLKSMLKKFIP